MNNTENLMHNVNIVKQDYSRAVDAFIEIKKIKDRFANTIDKQILIEDLAIGIGISSVLIDELRPTAVALKSQKIKSPLLDAYFDLLDIYSNQQNILYEIKKDSPNSASHPLTF